MIKVFLTTLLAFYSLTSFSQEIISNTKTDKHRHIKSTKISLIPPVGLEDATNFSGFQQTESGSSIMVIVLPGPFSEVTKGFNKNDLLRTGVDASSIEKMQVNSYPGLFITGTQEAYETIYQKYVLVFGSEKETIMINGVVPAELTDLGNKIKESILSVLYDENINLDPFENVDYTINYEGTKLIFAQNVAGSLIFTVDGQVPSSSEDQTNLVVAKSFSPINEEDKKQFSINRLKQTPIEFVDLTTINEIKINELTGYEIYAKGKDKKSGKIETIYQVTLFRDNMYYILFGSTNDQTGDSIEQIKTVVKTFQLK